MRWVGSTASGQDAPLRPVPPMLTTHLRTLKLAAISVLGMAFLSCSLPTEVCGCTPVPPDTSTLVVKGVVQHADQRPAGFTFVRVTVFAQSCTNSPLTVDGQSGGIADAEGRFRFALRPELAQGMSLDSACVRVSAFANPETSAELGSTERRDVHVPASAPVGSPPTTQPRDSAEFTVTLGQHRQLP